jgi:uncharacterized protein
VTASDLNVPRITIEYDVPVALGDGITLRADVFRPAKRGRYPAILVRTPYDKLTTAAGFSSFAFDPLAAVRAGYVVVFQDVRGTFASTGEFDPFVHELDDGVAAIGWTATQDWSDGRVGMAGGSYLGFTQLYAAAGGHPALRAIAPAIAGSDLYRVWYSGGAFQLHVGLTWAAQIAAAELTRRERHGQNVDADRDDLKSLLEDLSAGYAEVPLMEVAERSTLLSHYKAVLSHPDEDAYWRARALSTKYAALDVPALHITGWNDFALTGALENFVALRTGAASAASRKSQRLVVTPWGHCPPSEVLGELWYGSGASPVDVDLQGLHFDFFDRFVREMSTAEQAPVRIFVMGANRWRNEDEWPLARALATRYHLRQDRRLTREPPADEPPDSFVYDPARPVPTVGGASLRPDLGPRDRRIVHQRNDVLLYSSDQLMRDVEVTGPISATLNVSTSARDTDFTVALIDIYPDGRSIGITDGILRLRYRNGLVSQDLVSPNGLYEITVGLAATSNVFPAGHRIGVEISSSNFPRFDRNPNHGGVIAEATKADFVIARQVIFHDVVRPSYVTLPVVPM